MHNLAVAFPGCGATIAKALQALTMPPVNSPATVISVSHPPSNISELPNPLSPAPAPSIVPGGAPREDLPHRTACARPLGELCRPRVRPVLGGGGPSKDCGCHTDPIRTTATRLRVAASSAAWGWSYEAQGRACPRQPTIPKACGLEAATPTKAGRIRHRMPAAPSGFGTGSFWLTTRGSALSYGHLRLRETTVARPNDEQA